MRLPIYEVVVAGHKRQFRLNATDAARFGATLVKPRATAKKKDKE
jgi:hypothetical protein